MATDINFNISLADPFFPFEKYIGYRGYRGYTYKVMISGISTSTNVVVRVKFFDVFRMEPMFCMALYALDSSEGFFNSAEEYIKRHLYSYKDCYK